MLYQSRNTPSCRQMRQELDREMRQMLKEHPNLPMANSLKIKVLFYKLGTATFVLFFDAYLRTEVARHKRGQK